MTPKSNITNISNVFKDCTSITSVPMGFFEDNHRNILIQLQDIHEKVYAPFIYSSRHMLNENQDWKDEIDSLNI